MSEPNPTPPNRIGWQQKNGELPGLQGPSETLDEGYQRLARVKRIRCGFKRMEGIAKPQAEAFWAIGGRPGAFKTGLEWNLALQVADLGGRVLVESLEMPLGYLGLLAVARFSGLSKERIAAAKRTSHPQLFTAQEHESWRYGDETYRNLSKNLRLHGPTNGRTLRDVLVNACKMAFDVVMVDHIGMMDRDAGNELMVLNRNVDALRGLAQGEVSKGYRPLVIATSQFNREIEKTTGDRSPRLSDFRAAARIEHDTDVAIGLKKTKIQGLGEESSAFGLEAHILKNRNGPSPLVIGYEVNGETNGIEELTEPTKQPKQGKLPMGDTHEEG